MNETEVHRAQRALREWVKLGIDLLLPRLLPACISGPLCLALRLTRVFADSLWEIECRILGRSMQKVLRLHLPSPALTSPPAFELRPYVCARSDCLR